MGTIKKLILGADAQAHRRGEDEPGAEHYLLSALELPDGSARRVFERIGVDPSGLQQAIQEQYRSALDLIGVDDNGMIDDSDPVISNQLLHQSKPSGQAVMKKLYELKKGDKDAPLIGAHVVAVIAAMEHGVAVRAFNTMGVDQRELSTAAQDEFNSGLL